MSVKEAFTALRQIERPMYRVYNLTQALLDMSDKPPADLTVNAIGLAEVAMVMLDAMEELKGAWNAAHDRLRDAREADDMVAGLKARVAALEAVAAKMGKDGAC